MDISGYRSINGNWYTYVAWEQEQLRLERCEECDRLRSKLHWPDIERHLREAHGPKKSKTYAFTFTTNLDTKLEVQQEMCGSAWKLFQQRTTPVEEGEVYLEYTEEGRPHLHGWYVTQDGGRIFAKTFRRCWRYWGEKARQTKFAGGYHELMKTQRYKGYSSTEERLVVMKKKDADAVYYAETADKWHI